MSLGIVDSLFHWIAEHGMAVPTIGGRPTFSRAGTAYSKQPEALSLLYPFDTPRHQPDGLLLELGQENTLSGPFAFDNTIDNWNNNTNFTISAVTSIFDGKIAYKHVNDGGGARQRNQTIGVLTANPETYYVVVENVDGVLLRLGLRDITVNDWVARTNFDLDDGTNGGITAGAGSNTSAGSKLSMIVGPNGGKVWLFWITATPDNAGNIRALWIYPTNAPINTEAVILHAAQHVEAGLFTSPIDGIRATETFYWDGAPQPQAMVIYNRWRAVMNNRGEIENSRIWSLGDTDPRMLLFHSSNTTIRFFFDNNIDAAKIAGFTINPTPGDVLECVCILNSDGSGRFVGRINSGAVLFDSFTAPASGLPTIWEANKLSLNSDYTGGSKGAGIHQAMKIVKQTNVVSALDGSGTGDEDIMAEMAGFWISKDGRSFSNAVV